MIRAHIRKMTVEEMANTITHGFGLLLSVVGFVLLLVLASGKDSPWYLVSAIVYGASLVILYGASTVYHGATSPERKKVLQIVDHCCIYLLIAGSYTPFLLIVLRETQGKLMMFLIWAIAAAGITMKLIFGKRFPVLSVISYLAMGWLGVVSVGPLTEAVGFAPIVLVILGGVAYSAGVIFFAWESMRHHHAIWHVFVLLGSIFHFLAIALYVFPYGPAAG